MTKWPWLMIILALISTVQWPNSIAQHNCDNNAQQEEYLWYPRKYHRTKRTSLSNGRNIISTTTSSIAENRKIENRIKNNNTNLRNSSISNITKFSVKNEYPSNNSHVQTKSSSTIVFPNSSDGKISKIAINTFKPEPSAIEKCSMNGSYCIKVDNYPRLELLNIFRSSKFISHHISIDDTENEINDVQTRISNNLRPICDSREEVIFPEAGLTKKNEWLYIVQDHINESSSLRQGIKVEMCSKSDASNEVVSNCKFNDYLPVGFSSVCIQKYIYKKLMTIDNSKEIYYEKFLFPSCCTCMYSELNSDTKTRRGGEVEYQRFSQSHLEP